MLNHTSTTVSNDDSNESTATSSTTTSSSIDDIDFTKNSAIECLACLHAGWNLGNSLDSYSSTESASIDETSWGNPEITSTLLEGVKDAGFDFIRIPVSWLNHTDTSTTDYTIDSDWMARVKEVVDMAIDAGLTVVINVHHDGVPGNWLDISEADDSNDNYDAITTRFEAVWTQIADEFKDYDEHLMFEGMNEIQDGGWGWSSEYTSDPSTQNNILDKWNQAFVTTVRETGGNNTYRYLVIPGYAANPSFTLKYLSIPDDPQEDEDGIKRLIVTYHFYQPDDFCLNATVNKWGSESGGVSSSECSSWGQEDHVREIFDEMKETYIDEGYGVYMGEFGATYQGSSYVDYQRYYDEYVVKYAHDLGILPIIWDNGSTGSGSECFGLFDRDTGAVLDTESTVVTAIKRASSSSYSLSDIEDPSD